MPGALPHLILGPIGVISGAIALAIRVVGGVWTSVVLVRLCVCGRIVRCRLLLMLVVRLGSELLLTLDVGCLVS